MIKITFPDNSVKEFEAGVTPLQVAESISPRLAREVLAASVDGKEWDLSRPMDSDASLKLFKWDDPEGKHAFWHSSAHLLAEALQELYPGVKFGIGPAIENGFYYDIDPGENKITSDDFAKIEAKMTELARRDEQIVRADISKADALALFGDRGEEYKCELISELEDGSITTYTQGAFTDLCRGPHIPTTAPIKAVKITSLAGAALRDRLEQFLRKIQRRYGYKQVITPHIGNKQLYVTSGHYAKYGKDSFQPIHTPEEGEEYLLKPMNCPHHCEIFRALPRSYRDLPLRLAEFGTVYRYEQSGELHGLTRVRGFTQDDAHIFCTPEQIKDEFLKVMDIILYIFKALKFENYEAQISLRDPSHPEKYIGSDENWHLAENAIIEACAEKGLNARTELGEAAFYGPKLDFMVRDAIGRRWQLGTIQVDYNLPERFELEYTGSDNAKHRPVMIHRAPFGSMERFVAVLLEHTAGRFPLWLAPEQAVLIPVSDKYLDYAREVAVRLEDADIRIEIDDRNETLGRKIRDNQLKRIPYMLIVGEKEAENGEVSVRKSGEGDLGSMKIATFAELLTQEVNQMINQ